MNITYLQYRCTTSRGRDTYGYNLVSLEDTSTGKKYRTCGGGYDMLGTVLGKWLKDSKYWDNICLLPTQHGSSDPNKGYYGLTNYGGKRGIDGACGFSCMVNIARAVGLDVQTVYSRDKKGRCNKMLGIQIIDKNI